MKKKKTGRDCQMKYLHGKNTAIMSCKPKFNPFHERSLSWGTTNLNKNASWVHTKHGICFRYSCSSIDLPGKTTRDTVVHIVNYA